MAKKIFYIEIPDHNDLGSSWVSLGSSETKEEAVEWIRENIGWCDDEGRMCLLSECEVEEDED